MGRLRWLILGGWLAGLGPTAHATSYMYNLVGVTTAMGTLTGTLTVDSVTDGLTGVNITLNDAAAGNPAFNSVTASAGYPGPGQNYTLSGPGMGSQSAAVQVALLFNMASAGSGPLTICTTATTCGTQSVELEQVTVNGTSSSGGAFPITGSLVPQTTRALTPEPPSLALFGTGALVFAVGVGRKTMREGRRKRHDRRR